MTRMQDLETLGLFNARVPRYTSYPTAPAFQVFTDGVSQSDWLGSLKPEEPVSVYLHIPFCERLCWFCACRTQGTQTLAPLDGYINTLRAELDLVAEALPPGIRMGRLHWGGGTPTILPPNMIHSLAQAIKSVIPPADNFEFSVEIDPTAVNAEKIRALQWEGMNRASIGIQDFAQKVQSAIGRLQSAETTRACIDMLRDAGIRSLNTDLVYGLPHQTPQTIRASLDHVLDLGPDRLALFGYAHVPWMAKRQRLIDETTLPDDRARYALFNVVAEALIENGYQAIGIDHFATTRDSLSQSAATGHLRRNFQGYTDDTCPSLIGLGASAISKFEQGYVQNAAATGAYTQRIEAGQLAGYRGHAFLTDDKLRGRAIEMLMCDFRIDLAELQAGFGDASHILDPIHSEVALDFAPFIQRSETAITISPDGRPLTRIIARRYDAYDTDGVSYSRAS